MTDLTDEQAAVIDAARTWAVALTEVSFVGFAEYQRIATALTDAVKALDAAERPTLEQALDKAKDEWVDSGCAGATFGKFTAHCLREAGLVKEDAS